MTGESLLRIDLVLTIAGITTFIVLGISLTNFLKILSQQVRFLQAVIFEERKDTMADFTKLIDAVQKNTDLEASIIQVLNEVAAELKTIQTASNEEQNIVDSLVQKLTSNAGALTDAIVANTRAAHPIEPVPAIALPAEAVPPMTIPVETREENPSE